MKPQKPRAKYEKTRAELLAEFEAAPLAALFAQATVAGGADRKAASAAQPRQPLAICFPDIGSWIARQATAPTTAKASAVI